LAREAPFQFTVENKDLQFQQLVCIDKRVFLRCCTLEIRREKKHGRDGVGSEREREKERERLKFKVKY